MIEAQRNVHLNYVANDKISQLKETGENPKQANLTKAIFTCLYESNSNRILGNLFQSDQTV